MGIRISEMEEATTFGADDYVPIVTGGTNKKAIGQKIKDFIKGGFTAARAVVTDAEDERRAGKLERNRPKYKRIFDK